MNSKIGRSLTFGIRHHIREIVFVTAFDILDVMDCKFSNTLQLHASVFGANDRNIIMEEVESYEFT